MNLIALCLLHPSRTGARPQEDRFRWRTPPSAAFRQKANLGAAQRCHIRFVLEPAAGPSHLHCAVARLPLAPTLLQGVELLAHAADGSVKRVRGSEALNGKAVGLYFSAHWCPPCRAFTPVLAEVYRTLKHKRDDFEVVFVSGDRDAAQAEVGDDAPAVLRSAQARNRARKLCCCRNTLRACHGWRSHLRSTLCASSSAASSLSWGFPAW